MLQYEDSKESQMRSFEPESFGQAATLASQQRVDRPASMDEAKSADGIAGQVVVLQVDDLDSQGKPKQEEEDHEAELEQFRDVFDAIGDLDKEAQLKILARGKTALVRHKAARAERE